MSWCNAFDKMERSMGCYIVVDGACGDELQNNGGGSTTLVVIGGTDTLMSTTVGTGKDSKMVG